MSRETTLDVDILQAALTGFQLQLALIDAEMAEIRAMLGQLSPSSAAAGAKPAGKRVLSAAARRRMAVAQRKRWAAYRREGEPSKPAKKAESAKPVAKRRKLSAAGKKRIADANKKRWAAFRAAKATGPAKE